MRKVSLFKPTTGIEEANAVQEVLESGWLGMGPKTELFEKKFSSMVGTKYAVALNSCTAALILAIKALDIGPGDEVIVPTITFIATAHAVEINGAKPIFCDVNAHTLLLDIESAKYKISSRTKAIVPVHVAGRCVDIPKLKKVVGKDIKIIEDCAHASGSYFQNKHAGSMGDIGCFSFHATKNITAGDGGMIVTNNFEVAKRIKNLSWLGLERHTLARVKNNDYMWHYDVPEIGQKYHMNDVSAAIGLVQLNKLTKANARRKEIAELYSSLLTDQVVCLPPLDSKNIQSSWHIFFIQIKDRDEVSKFLSSKGITTGVHYKPIHLYKCYGNITSLPTAEKVWKNILSLPIHPQLTDDDVKFVVSNIEEFLL